MTYHTLTAHRALLERARVALATDCEVPADRAEIIADLDAAIDRALGPDAPGRLLVRTMCSIMAAGFSHGCFPG